MRERMKYFLEMQPTIGEVAVDMAEMKTKG